MLDVNFVNISSTVLLLVVVTCQVVMLRKIHKLNSYLDLETYSKVYKAMLRKHEMDMIKKNNKNKRKLANRTVDIEKEKKRAKKAKADRTKVVIKTG